MNTDSTKRYREPRFAADILGLFSGADKESLLQGNSTKPRSSSSRTPLSEVTLAPRNTHTHTHTHTHLTDL